MELLRPAADGLRRALKRMDDDDVPASLRPLRDSSARKLPPPMLRRALLELDADEWLRAETAAEVEFEPGTATDLFVNRPQGWEAALETQIEQAASSAGAQEASEIARDLDVTRRKLARLEADLKTTAARETEVTAEVERRFRSRLDAAARARRRSEEDKKAAEGVARLAGEEAARLRAELAEAGARLEGLRQMLERSRKAGEAPSGTPARGWFPESPLEMAAELDRIVLAVSRSPLGEPGAEAEDERPGRLPAGLRPDRAEAVRWLIGQRTTWLVDGYNLAFHLDPEPGRPTRDRIVAALTRIVTLSAASVTAVVAFDSSVEESALPSNRRVRVVYVPSADDWIMARAGPGTVVVSSDRQVREAAEAAGAVGLWSEALAAWMTRRK